MRLADYVARMGEMGNAYKILVEKSEGMRLFCTCGRRWEDSTEPTLRV